MKRIEYPAPVSIVDLNGKPVADDDGSDAVWPFRTYARMLLAQRAFTNGLDQIEGMELVLKTKQLLDASPDGPSAIDLEDDPRKRLLAAAREWQGHPAWSYCLLPFAQAIRDAKAPAA